MFNVPVILRMRRRRARRQAHQSLFPGGLAFSLALSLLAIAFILFSAAAYVSTLFDLPSLEALPALLDSPGGLLLEPTRLYDRTGTHELAVLENPAAAGHQYLYTQPQNPNRFPEALIQATLAAQDPTFWQHSGFSFAGLQSETHPTLAQQLVFDTLLYAESPGLRRNLRERLLAAQITARFGKEQILEWYLNHARYGDLLYGADAAARAFFAKSAKDLSLAEAATLAAVARQPEITPYQAPQLVMEGQKAVLQAMLALGWVTAEEVQQAMLSEVVFQPSQPIQNPAPAFIDLALAQLAYEIPQERLERGGWRIITTLDLDLQNQVTCAANVLRERLGADPGLAATPAETADGLPNACEAARLLPTLPLQTTNLPNLEAGVIVLEPVNGQVLSLVGVPQMVSPAHAPARPIGTLNLPFLYLTAFTRGFSPGSLAWDIPPAAEEAVAGQAVYHGPVRLRTALVNDYIQPARHLLAQFGLPNAISTGRQLGAYTDDAMPELAMSPAGNSASEWATFLEQPGSLLGIAQAYATLSNQGISAGQSFPALNNTGGTRLQPYTILRVEDRSGQIWLDWSGAQQRSVLSPQLAYLINHVLSDETARWPTLGHPNPLEIGRPAGAKLGQTLQQQDAWAAGYTPQRLAVVWIGQPMGENADPVPTQAAAALWHAVIQYAMRNLPSTGWETPIVGGISEIQVCDPSGLLPTVFCPTVVNEVFLTGSEPTQLDNLYRISQINRETGRLATIFTPPELLEDRVYLVVPPEARAWSEQAGLPTPPEDYDVLYAPPAVSPDVHISTPVMFSQVRGQVSLTGSAAGTGFKSFRLNFGQGLNPQQWLQIGQESTRPVREGTLGVWDTEGLSGLFALQLQVVRQDQRIETAVIQVTVDNVAPEITLLGPTEGSSFHMAEQPNIILSASATDDLELAQVIFYIDDRQTASFIEPPFTIAWPSRLGEHTWKAVAIDLAGNQETQTASFSVK